MIGSYPFTPLYRATHVQNEDGSLLLLNPRNITQRQGIAKRLLAPDKISPSGGVAKKVYRHLKNGDILLVNRQPTLHKPSIMAMKVWYRSGCGLVILMDLFN